MIWLLAFAILICGAIAIAAIFALHLSNLQLAHELQENRKDRQSITNSLLRDLNKPVFDTTPAATKPTKQWFTGKTVLVVPEAKS